MSLRTFWSCRLSLCYIYRGLAALRTPAQRSATLIHNRTRYTLARIAQHLRPLSNPVLITTALPIASILPLPSSTDTMAGTDTEKAVPPTATHDDTDARTAASEGSTAAGHASSAPGPAGEGEKAVPAEDGDLEKHAGEAKPEVDAKTEAENRRRGGGALESMPPIPDGGLQAWSDPVFFRRDV